MNVSLIIVNFGPPTLLLRCLASLAASGDRHVVREVVVVDNGHPAQSDSDTALRASHFPFDVRVVPNREASYSSGVNRGAVQTTGDCLLIANSDVEFLPGESIQTVLDYFARHPRVGVVGPQLVYPNGDWQRSHGRVPGVWQALISTTLVDSALRGIEALCFRSGLPMGRSWRVGYVDGAFLLTRRTCFDAMHGFDERYSFYGEDTDYCWRASRARWGVRFLPTVRVRHVRGGSSAATAPEAYAARLLDANLDFVRHHFGQGHARWYRRLVSVAALERAAVYQLAAALTRSDRLRRLAAEAGRDVQILRRTRP
jgi:GT2 family glycosyltransferase